MSNEIVRTVRFPWYASAVLILLLGFPLGFAFQALKAEYFVHRANQELLETRFDEALVLYREATKESPANARLALDHAGLARTLWIFRETPELNAEADQAFDEAKRLSPHWPIPHYQHARMYSFKGDYKHALQLLAPALRLDPNNAGYWLEAARYSEKVSKTKEAKAAYERCWALDRVRECENGIQRLGRTE